MLLGCSLEHNIKKVSEIALTDSDNRIGTEIPESRRIGKSGRSINVVFKQSYFKKSTTPRTPYDRMTAVVIGIDRYRNLSVDKQLKYAVRDAKGIEAVLRKHFHYKRIISLYNEKATKDQIIKVIQGDLSQSGPNDGVLIYFAGHGITFPTDQGELGYLVPYDGSLKAEETYKNISMQQIKNDISKLIPAKHVLYIFDACFGGLILSTRSASILPSRNETYLRRITEQPVRQIITAGGKDEVVLDGGIGGHSVFSGRVIAALKDVQQFITARELGLKIQQQVSQEAAKQGHKQVPLVGEIYGTGDFVFMRNLPMSDSTAEREIKILEGKRGWLKRLSGETEFKAEKARISEPDRQKLRKDASIQPFVLELEEAANEINRINTELARIETRFKAELDTQLKSYRKHYDGEITKAKRIKPRDKNFETVADYKKRLARQKKTVRSLETERREREQEIIDQLLAQRAEREKPLRERKQKIVGSEFRPGKGKVNFKLKKYFPEDRKLMTLVEYKNKSGKSLFSLVHIPMQKARAREYWHNPDLLVPEVTMGVDPSGKVFAKKLVLYGPEGRVHASEKIVQITQSIDIDIDLVDYDGRFIECASGVVRDTKTGLEWIASRDKEMMWENSRSWAKKLTVDGGGWRMPTLKELRTLYQKGVGKHNINQLLKVSKGYIWSGEKLDYKTPLYFDFHGACEWGGKDYFYLGGLAVRSRRLSNFSFAFIR